MLRSCTPVLYVDAIEPVLPFWERLGFARVAEVPHGDRLGFVIFVRDGVQVMYQTHASVDADVPGVPMARDGTVSVGLYLSVDDLETVARAMEGETPAVPRRTTFYGADEIGWREPGGHFVVFAQHAPEEGAAG